MHIYREKWRLGILGGNSSYGASKTPSSPLALDNPTIHHGLDQWVKTLFMKIF